MPTLDVSKDLGVPYRCREMEECRTLETGVRSASGSGFVIGGHSMEEPSLTNTQSGSYAAISRSEFRFAGRPETYDEKVSVEVS